MDIQEKKITRREFLSLGIAAGFAVAAIASTYSVFKYLYPTEEAAQQVEEKIMVASLDELPPGSAKFFRFRNKPSVVINHNGKITALSAVCTHLGCIVKWDGDQQLLKCPCHAGVFDSSGRVLAGPPPAPLPALKALVANNKIYVG